jgi:photosystem II stability/assembly factor-like uncharacterized protein
MKAILLFAFLSFAGVAGAQWQNLYSFTNPAISFITVNTKLYAGLAGGGVYMSPDEGGTWNAMNNGIQFGGAYIFSLTNANDSLYAGAFGEVYISKNGGENWTSLDLHLDLNDFVYAVKVKDNYLFAGIRHGPGNGIYRKALTVAGWLPMHNGIPANLAVNALAIDGNQLLAATDSGVYVSSDNGAAWTRPGNATNPGLPVKSLLVIDGNIVAGTTNGIYISSDHCNTWNTATGLPTSSVVTCFSANNGYIVAGTYASAFYSVDNGLTWNMITNAVEGTVSYYSVTALNNYFYAGTGGGITSGSFVSKISMSFLSLPGENKLKQGVISVEPNPWVTQTTLQSTVMLNDATLTIFNSIGQRVQQLKNISGQVITIYRGNLPAGLYILSISENNNPIATRKIIIADN